jgi:hypothetical protein
MGTHFDSDHGKKRDVLQELRLKSELLTELGKNRVTNDRVLEEWQHCGVRVQMLPDDEQGVLRISIGGHPDHKPSEYCNFRGDQGRCISLLQRCLAAMQAHTP